MYAVYAIQKSAKSAIQKYASMRNNKQKYVAPNMQNMQNIHSVICKK